MFRRTSVLPLRRVLIAVVLLIGVAAAADALLWRFATQRLESGFAAWAAAARAQGWTVRAGTPQAGGWPLAAEVSLPDLSVQGGTDEIPGGLTWRAARVTLQVALLRPHQVKVGAFGRQHLRLSSLPDIPFVADRMDAVLPLTASGVPPVANIAAEHLRAALPIGGVAQDVTVADAALQLTGHPDAGRDQPGVVMQLDARQIGLPSSGHYPLGASIASLQMDAALDGPIPPPGADPVRRAAAWRDGGGQIAIRRLAMVWGPLAATVSATLTLDGALQPTGNINLRTIGEQAALDRLAAGGVMKRRTATVAKAVIGLMPHTVAADGESETDLHLSLEDRTLSLGRIPLLKLPDLTWTVPQEKILVK